MSNPIATAACPCCTQTFKKLFSHQIYCTTACAFWSRVQKGFTCWQWCGSTHINGYGEFRFNSKLVRAHRFSYELHYGPLGAKDHVLHRCDNPVCCNPDHLYAGDQAQNMRDASVRYRNLQKLTVDQARSAERRIRAGDPVAQIARDCGVTYQAIYARKKRMKREIGRILI